MKFKDFTNHEVDSVNLGGVAPKLVVKDQLNRYLIKFPRERLGIRINDHISEYLGCKIAKDLGYAVQEVELGNYKGEECVSCTMFKTLPTAFGGLGPSTLEGKLISYNLDEILKLHMNESFNITQLEYEIEIWKMFSLDLLLGNYDRHQNNWGFIKNTNEKYDLAPLYDFGSTLSSRRIGFTDNKDTDKEIVHSMTHEGRSSIKYKERHTSFYKMAITYKDDYMFNQILSKLIEDFSKIDLDRHLSIIRSFNSEYIDYSNFIKRVINLKLKIYKEMGFKQ